MHLFAKGMRDAGVSLDLLYLGDIGEIARFIRAREEVREQSRRYDLVHAQFGSACALVTSAALGPKVVSLRGSDWHRYPGPQRAEALHGRLAHFLTRLRLASFDAVVAVSARMAGEVEAAFPGSRVSVLPDPIDLGLFRPHSRAGARAALFATTVSDPWVLFTTLSTSNSIKRIDLATEAVRIARQSVPTLEMRVASGIPHSSMPLFVAACDVALCTSTHEGWPNSVKEALACGVPFVSTDVSDLGEIARRNPSCFVCQPDAEALADGLVQSLAAGRDEALRREVEVMDVESTCSRLLDIYRSVLA